MSWASCEELCTCSLMQLLSPTLQQAFRLPKYFPIGCKLHEMCLSTQRSWRGHCSKAARGCSEPWVPLFRELTVSLPWASSSLSHPLSAWFNSLYLSNENGCGASPHHLQSAKRRVDYLTWREDQTRSGGSGLPVAGLPSSGRLCHRPSRKAWAPGLKIFLSI